LKPLDIFLNCVNVWCWFSLMAGIFWTPSVVWQIQPDRCAQIVGRRAIYCVISTSILLWRLGG